MSLLRGRWLWGALVRIRELAGEGRVVLTLKARQELEVLGLGVRKQDIEDILASLTPADAVGRVPSSVSGEWLLIFKPAVGGVRLYVKLVLREACVVISFHEDDSI